MMKISCVFICVCVLTMSIQSRAQISLEEFASGLNNPVDIASALDQSGRLFIVEQQGSIRIVDQEGNVLSESFLDLTSKVGNGSGERGLLGLAFHPDYMNNGYFFVYYTSTVGENFISVVERYQVSADSNIADINSGEVVLTFEQPFSNHNGGDLNFGSDGYLYIASGDGGSGNDPHQRGQDLSSPLGKILRIDVDQLPYGVPADNPFAQATGDTLDIIWAYGLRNPWRFSFDGDDIWIADVGQTDREEINYVNAADHIGGLNYGWSCREGNIDCPGCNESECAKSFIEPIHWYGPGPGLSVTGGLVFRGNNYDEFKGQYVFADFVREEIRTLSIAPGNMISVTSTLPAQNISTFGADESGYVYAASLSGTIYRLVETGVLPVEILTLQIEHREKQVLLSWETGLEINASHFEIERSNGVNDFRQIGIVPTKGSNPDVTTSQYQFSDFLSKGGHYYYRLKAMDMDGAFEYSMVLDVYIMDQNEFVITPNPARNLVNVKMPVLKDQGVLQVTSLQGALLFSQEISAGDGRNIEIDISNLDRGLVLVQLSSEGLQYMQKLMLLR